jgi:hypothetical protein
MSIARSISRALPGRRRYWRFVSPRRHTIGLVLLAVLLGTIFWYWSLTNPGRVRRQAQEYLVDLLGGPDVATASVQSARFSLFRGIELRGVRVSLRGWDAPLVDASVVRLRNDPWGTLLGGRLDVRQITCPAPVVTIIRDAQTGRMNIDTLLRGQADEDAGAPAAWLPELNMRDALVVLMTRHPDEMIHRQQVRVHLSAETLREAPGPDARYVILWEQQRLDDEDQDVEDAQAPREHGKISVDLRTGRTEGQLALDVESLDEALRERFRRWKEDYSIRGRLELLAEWDPASRSGTLVAVLQGLEATLPPDQGGLHIEGLTGRVSFSKTGVRMEGLAGSVAGSGGRFSLEGRYDGFEPDSPFRIDVQVRQMPIPPPSGRSGAVADALTYIEENLSPAGPWDLDVEVRRDEAGQFHLEGSALPRGVSIAERTFPYRLHELTGEIRFNNDAIILSSLDGNHGDARVHVEGLIRHPLDRSRRTRAIRIHAEDVAFDDSLREAVPPEYEVIWERFRPRGSTDAAAEVRVDEPGGPEKIQVTLRPEGKSSFEYSGFPYRLESVRGEIVFSAEKVELRSVSGRSGLGRARLDGEILTPPDAGRSVDVEIVASLPIDERLERALGQSGSELFELLEPAGRLESVVAQLRADAGEPMDYRVLARVAEGSFKAAELPLRIGDAAARLLITPESVEISELTGRCGPAGIEGRAKAYVGREPIGLNLSVDAEGMDVAGQLLPALPESARQSLDPLSPRGRCNLSVQYYHNTPEIPAEKFYIAVVEPRGLALAHPALPRPLEEISGQIVLSPDRVALWDVHARLGDGKVQVGGEALADGDETEAKLHFLAEALPLDADLLKSLADSSIPLPLPLQPGGTLDANLQPLVLRWKRNDPGEDASTRPETEPDAPPIRSWSARGRLALTDARPELGLGGERLTGWLEGTADSTPAGLRLDANLDIASLSVGPREISGLTGTLSKLRGGQIVQFEDLSGSMHGGRLEGIGEIRLAEPADYAFRFSVDDVELSSLFNAGVEDPNRLAEVKGRLQGRLSLTARRNRPESRQIAGALHITRARLVKIPLLLGLVNIMYLSLPQEWAFDEAYLTYHLKGHTLRLEEAYLIGSAMSVVGSGTIDTRSQQLDMTFLAGPAGKLPRLNQLAEELLQGIVRELVQWRLTGTVRKPRTRAVPLRTLEEILRRILEPPA